ncbi:hypothetical protein SKAU_G00003610 [Synaphobranchus kaupii]|uniref:Uncharacterized protein n=1 Tax=Synaphobranchus kaupii TaxID=118154 RepID=A0A9Q1G9K6_SYNKA|nr:hypothetical protein SKAU_G00003610 [Synaphobranchus kaupii]
MCPTQTGIVQKQRALQAAEEGLLSSSACPLCTASSVQRPASTATVNSHSRTSPRSERSPPLLLHPHFPTLQDPLPCLAKKPRLPMTARHQNRTTAADRTADLPRHTTQARLRNENHSGRTGQAEWAPEADFSTD